MLKSIYSFFKAKLDNYKRFRTLRDLKRLLPKLNSEEFSMQLTILKGTAEVPFGFHASRGRESPLEKVGLLSFIEDLKFDHSEERLVKKNECSYWNNLPYLFQLTPKGEQFYNSIFSH